MKNIDLAKLTKVELINGIINLTNKYNECVRSRGYLNTHKVLSANTLRTKTREFLEEEFEHAWDWLREEIRAYYNVLDVDVDKSAIDDLKTTFRKKEVDNYLEYNNVVLTGEPEITGIILDLINNAGLLQAFSDIHENDIKIVVDSSECVRISLQKSCDIRYYHRRSWESKIIGKDIKTKDEINFGTMGSFDLDSLQGHQQLFQMSLVSHLGIDVETRAKINKILDRMYHKNIDRIRINSKINTDFVEALDENLAPYINSVAMGEFLWKSSKTK